jgi:hypothetical protein
VNQYPGIQVALKWDEQEKVLAEEANQNRWDASVKHLVSFLGLNVDSHLLKEFTERKALQDCGGKYVERARNLILKVFNHITEVVFQMPVSDLNNLNGDSCLLCSKSNDITVSENIFTDCISFNIHLQQNLEQSICSAYVSSNTKMERVGFLSIFRSVGYPRSKVRQLLFETGFEDLPGKTLWKYSSLFQEHRDELDIAFKIGYGTKLHEDRVFAAVDFIFNLGIQDKAYGYRNLKYVDHTGSEIIVKRPDWMLSMSPSELAERYYKSGIENPVCKSSFLQIVNVISTKSATCLAGVDNIAQDAKDAINNLISKLNFLISDVRQVEAFKRVLEDGRDGLKDHLVENVKPINSAFQHDECSYHCIPFAFEGVNCTQGTVIDNRYYWK